jgi:hypothetical protein
MIGQVCSVRIVPVILVFVAKSSSCESSSDNELREKDDWVYLRGYDNFELLYTLFVDGYGIISSLFFIPAYNLLISSDLPSFRSYSIKLVFRLCKGFAVCSFCV